MIEKYVLIFLSILFGYMIASILFNVKIENLTNNKIYIYRMLRKRLELYEENKKFLDLSDDNSQDIKIKKLVNKKLINEITLIINKFLDDWQD